VKINSTLYLQKPNLATLYYVIRHYDKKGAGWVCVSISKLVKMSKLSLSTIYKLLKELLASNWIYNYELKGNSKDSKGQVYIKYVSDVKILTNTYNIKVKPLYVVAPYKLLYNKVAIKGRCYLGQMNFNQAVIENKLEYSIGKRKIVGQLLSLKTVKAENKKLRYPTNKAKVGPLDSTNINDLKSAITGRCYDSNTSNYDSVQEHISYAIKGQHGVKVLNKSSYKVAAITSQTLANKLNVNRKTVDKYLRQYSNNRVKLYRRCSLIEATTEAPYVIWDIDEDRGICDAYRPLPFLYTKNVLHSHQRALIKKPLISYLNNEQLEVAKLCAITKGFSNDNEGAEAYIKQTGLVRFKKNTNCLSNKPKIYNSHYLYKGQLTTEPATVYL
jgi:hypothetical protein